MRVTCCAAILAFSAVATARAQSCESTDRVAVASCLTASVTTMARGLDSLADAVRAKLAPDKQPLFDASQRAWLASMAADVGFVIPTFAPNDSTITRLRWQATHIQYRQLFLQRWALGLGIAPPAGGAGSTEERAITAAMRSDLRNLVTAEEAFFADSVKYTNNLAHAHFVASNGVTVTILTATNNSWSAKATHRDLPGMTCYMFVGNMAPPVAGMNEGEPRCSR